jgi:hypothetical protein
VINSSFVRSGNYSVRIASGADGPNLFSSTVAIKPNTLVTVNGYMARDEASLPTEVGSIAVRFNDSEGTQIIRTGQAGSAAVAGWQKISFSTTSPATTATVRLDCGEAAGTGAWFFDDCSLLAMPSPTSRFILASPQVGWSNTPWRSGPASDFQLEFVEVFS